MYEKPNYHSNNVVYYIISLFIWSTTFLKDLDRFKKTISRVVTMKNVFRWLVIILINKPHFLFFGKTWSNFSCKQKSWTLNISKLTWRFVAWLILFALFAYSVIQNSLIWPGFFFFFFFQNLLDIVIVKRHFVLFWQMLS